MCSISNTKPVYHTSNISEILHIIMEPSLATISQIVQDSFDFKNRLDKDCPNGITLISNMIFFIQQLNTGLKNCKMI